jgi:hypothetical protein
MQPRFIQRISEDLDPADYNNYQSGKYNNLEWESFSINPWFPIVKVNGKAYHSFILNPKKTKTFINRVCSFIERN